MLTAGLPPPSFSPSVFLYAAALKRAVLRIVRPKSRRRAGTPWRGRSIMSNTIPNTIQIAKPASDTQPSTGPKGRHGIALPVLRTAPGNLQRRAGEYVPGQQEAGVVLTSVSEMLRWAQNYARSRSIWPLGYRPGLLRHRDDGVGAVALRSRAVRLGGLPLQPAPGGSDDRRRNGLAARWGRASYASTSRCPSPSG